jgi:hypothetical protein
MLREYTSKLFYKKYPYKLLISRLIDKRDRNYYQGYTVDNAKQFFIDNQISNRMYNSHVRGAKSNEITITSSIFLEKRADFDLCLDKWRDNVQCITTPYRDEHVQFLTDNTSIVIRETLIYRKFRYVVSFRRAYREDITDLTEWINNTFTLSPLATSSARYNHSDYRPKLYLRDDNDLVLVKLTHSDRIANITIIYTFDDLESAPNSP